MHPAFERFPAIDVKANGLRFRVRTAGPEKGERLALLLHGFPECWFSWRDQMPILADLGYRVWAPDLRGYGESDRPKGIAAYHVDHLVADVAGLIDASGAREVTLIAHDWGGAIAWEFVRRRTRPLARFAVLNMPYPSIMKKAVFRPGPQMRRSWYIFLFQLPWIPERYLAHHDYHAIKAAFLAMTVDRRRYPPEVLQVYRDSAARPGALTAMLNYYRAARKASTGPAVPDQPIETPTLMIWGEADTALGKELTYGTEKYVRDLTVRYIPNASHWVQQDAPETVNAMLAAWVSGKRVPETNEIG